MYSNKHIAIILPDTLQRLGLQNLLSDYFPQFETSLFATSTSFLQAKNYDSFDYYITSADLWICNMDFFLPRKGKTLLIADAISSVDRSTSLHQISNRSTTEQLIEYFEQL